MHMYVYNISYIYIYMHMHVYIGLTPSNRRFQPIRRAGRVDPNKDI